MTKFWEAFGGDVADSWVVQLISAPVLYLSVGFGAWIATRGWDHSGHRLTVWFAALSGTEQGLVAAGGLALCAVGNAVVSVFEPIVLRILEGYWPKPLSYLGKAVLALKVWRFAKRVSRMKELEARFDEGQLSLGEEAERDNLNVALHRYPPNPRDLLPTRLGNTLRAAEYRPRAKYGLDTIIVWPHLWLILPAATKEEIGDAQGRLAQSVSGVIWSTLLFVWMFVAWWTVFIALGAAWFFYYCARTSSEIYGDLMEAAFDLERVELYRRLRIKPPVNSTSEPALGRSVTQYLFRGQGAFDFTP